MPDVCINSFLLFNFFADDDTEGSLEKREKNLEKAKNEMIALEAKKNYINIITRTAKTKL